MKETYYFPHDYHSRNDIKLQTLTMEEIGIFWCLVEMLYEENGYIEISLIDFISKALRTNTENIKRVIFDYKLFETDNNRFWSNSILRRLEEREKKYELKAEAGRLGGIKSGISRKRKQNEAMLEANEANEPKERKGKESKYTVPDGTCVSLKIGNEEYPINSLNQ